MSNSIDPDKRPVAGPDPADPARPPVAAGQPGIKADESAPSFRIQTFFRELLKAIKTIALHRHATQQYGEFLQPAYKTLSSYLGEHQSLNLKVEQLEFTFADTKVYEEDASEQNLAFKFYRVGIRMLVFHQGLSAEELLKFVLICTANQTQTGFLGEDITSLLWQANFEHIEYVAIESYALGEDSSEQTRIDVDKIVNYLYQRLSTSGADSMSVVKLSLDDLETKLEDVEQAIGLTITEDAANADLKAQVQEDLARDTTQRLMARLPALLLDMFYLEMDEELERSVQSGFFQLIDSYLMQEDFDGIDKLFSDFRTLGQRQLPENNHPAVKRVFSGTRDKMREESTIDTLGQILDRTQDEEKRQRLQRYLRHMGPGAIDPLLRTLEGLNAIEARRQICDILAELGKDNLDLFIERLRSPKANLVRDMLYILDKLNPPDKMKLVAGLLEHPNLALRIEALKTIGSSKDAATAAFLITSLADKDAQVRVTAAGLLAANHRSLAWGPLLAMLNASDWNDRAHREQVSVASALAATGAPEALEHLRTQLQQTSLMGKKKLIEHQKTLLAGIAASGSAQALQVLEQEIQRGFKNSDLAAAAARAQKRLKERLQAAAQGGEQ